MLIHRIFRINTLTEYTTKITTSIAIDNIVGYVHDLLKG